MTPTSDVVDTGLQAERTALAWRRTALALLGATALLARLTYEPSPTIAIGIAVVGSTLAASLEWNTRPRLIRLALVIRAGSIDERAVKGALSLLTATAITSVGLIAAFAAFAG